MTVTLTPHSDGALMPGDQVRIMTTHPAGVMLNGLEGKVLRNLGPAAQFGEFPGDALIIQLYDGDHSDSFGVTSEDVELITPYL